MELPTIFYFYHKSEPKLTYIATREPGEISVTWEDNSSGPVGFDFDEVERLFREKVWIRIGFNNNKEAVALLNKG